MQKWLSLAKRQQLESTLKLCSSFPEISLPLRQILTSSYCWNSALKTHFAFKQPKSLLEILPSFQNSHALKFFLPWHMLLIPQHKASIPLHKSSRVLCFNRRPMLPNHSRLKIETVNPKDSLIGKTAIFLSIYHSRHLGNPSKYNAAGYSVDLKLCSSRHTSDLQGCLLGNLTAPGLWACCFQLIPHIVMRPCHLIHFLSLSVTLSPGINAVAFSVG